jgi:hypothetical protein
VPFSGASPARGAGALAGGLSVVAIEFTTTSEAVTVVSGKGHEDISLGDFSTGVATLTFPAHVKFLSAIADANTDNATASSRQDLLVRTVNYTAGTATVRCVDSASGATEAIADGTYRLTLLMGE